MAFLCILKDGSIVYSRPKKLPNLVCNLVSAVANLADKFYKDEFIYLEKEGIYISCYVSLTGVLIFYMSESPGHKDLSETYKAYSKTKIYDDMDLLDILIGDLNDKFYL